MVAANGTLYVDYGDSGGLWRFVVGAGFGQLSTDDPEDLAVAGG